MGNRFTVSYESGFADVVDADFADDRISLDDPKVVCDAMNDLHKAREASVIEGERRIAALEDRLADAQTCAITADREAARWAARVKVLEARLEAVVSAARGTG